MTHTQESDGLVAPFSGPTFTGRIMWQGHDIVAVIEDNARLRLELDEALNDKLEGQNERDMAIRQRRAAQVYAQELRNHFGLSDEKEGNPNV